MTWLVSEALDCPAPAAPHFPSKTPHPASWFWSLFFFLRPPPPASFLQIKTVPSTMVSADLPHPPPLPLPILDLFATAW